MNLRSTKIREYMRAKYNQYGQTVDAKQDAKEETHAIKKKKRTKKDSKTTRRHAKLFGRKFNFAFESRYARAPYNPLQKSNEIRRLQKVLNHPIHPNQSLDARLKSLLCATLARCDKLVVNNCIRDSSACTRIAQQHRPTSTHDLLRRLTVPQLYALLKKIHPDHHAEGTVVGFLPHTKEFVVRFVNDDAKEKDFLMQLEDIRQAHPVQETAQLLLDNVHTNGPGCPKCQHPLGFGYNAWKRCCICGFEYPGMLFSSERLNKYDPFRSTRLC